MSLFSSYADMPDARADVFWRQARLLVVDDEESVALTVSEVMRQDGLVVETALSGADAISKIQDTEYDVVLTDLHMEGADGISVLAEVRRHFPLTITIVLTGFASLESAIAAMRQGAYDYLIKPCIIDDMKQTVRRGIEHRRLMLAERDARITLEKLNRELEHRIAERTAELQIANEKLADANRAKDIFFATLSHELRTPLNAILGWAHILRTGKLDPERAARAFETIERNAQVQAQLISDILDISRIISGKLRLDFRAIRPSVVAEQAVEAIRPAAEAKKIQIETNFAPIQETVSGDPDRLQQVVLNLLSNAIKFTPEGGLVTVSVSIVDAEVEIRVSDTGIGIRSELIPHIFEYFRQGDAADSRSHGGLGLGLALVRNIIEMHGGTVRAESAGEGRGSTFTVTIPLKPHDTDSANSASKSAEKLAPPSTISLQGVTVLLVDDEQDVLGLFTTILEQRGANVQVVKTSAEALKTVEELKPDILVADIGIPDNDGYTLIRRIRALGPKRGGNLPAVALTAYAGPEHRLQAITAGFQVHLAKPVNPAELISTVAGLVGRS
ncbi:MAG TPA: response regulator [Acidobacteriota bacterium]